MNLPMERLHVTMEEVNKRIFYFFWGGTGFELVTILWPKTILIALVCVHDFQEVYGPVRASRP